MNKRWLMVGMAAALLAGLLQTAPAKAAQVSTDNPAGTPAATVVAGLTSMLTEHALLAGATLQKIADDDPDAGEARSQLAANTLMLTETIRALYGDDAANRFDELWTSHNDSYVTYVNGKTAGDAALQPRARDELDRFVQDVSSLLSQANPLLDRATLVTAMSTHVAQTLAVVDAYAAGDFARTYQLAHEGHRHMTETGTLLGSAIVRQSSTRFPGNPADPAAALRIQLLDLLSEHTGLAGLATTKAVAGKPDVPAILAQLDQNTQALTAFISNQFGSGAAQPFERLWRQHINDFARYAQGAATGDEGLRTQARDGLAAYTEEIGALLAPALGLSADALSDGFAVHVNGLAAAIDTYAARQYAASFRSLSLAHMHAADLAAAFAIAIANGPATARP